MFRYIRLQVIDIGLVTVQVVPQELDGSSNTLFEGVVGLPVGQLHNLLVAAQQTVNLALLGTDTLLITDDAGIGIDLADHFLCQLTNGNLLLCSNIDLLANSLVRLVDLIEAVGSILDKVEVSGGGQRSQFDFFLAGQQLGDDGGE